MAASGDRGDPRQRRHSPAQDSRRPVDRKSTRLNSSHEWISYAVFCLKKKKKTREQIEHGFRKPILSRTASNPGVKQDKHTLDTVDGLTEGGATTASPLMRPITSSCDA